MSSGDPGLQPERTVLAWRRTGLSAAVLLALLIREALTRPSAPGIAAALAAAGVTALCYQVTGASPGRHRLLAVTGGVALTGALVVAGSMT